MFSKEFSTLGTGYTLTEQDEVQLPALAIIVVSPSPTAVIFPFPSTVATFVLPELHVTVGSVALLGVTVATSVSESLSPSSISDLERLIPVTSINGFFTVT